MVKRATGNTHTLLKHKGSAVMGGITVKLIPHLSGNVEKNDIKRQNRQNEENYSCNYCAILIQVPQYGGNQV